MAFRLRRTLSVSSSILHHSLHQPKPISSTYSHLLFTQTPNPTSTAAPSQFTRPFTSTTNLFRKAFDPETDEIGPDTILFEGCDYNHWLITIDFPKDSYLTREQMIETYVNTAAQVFGSVEEAKKKIYALSTTTYQGFQVECSEETSEKFKNLPGVVFVLPDSYIDPVNKEYGGDKYVNGEIFPRPPPIHYGRRNNRDNRRPREQNYGPPPQQNYGPPPPQQKFGPPPPQQNYGPPPPQQNYGPPPPQQNYGPPPPQQNYGPPPPRQNYGPPPPQQNYGPPPPPRQNYVPPPPPQQNYGPPPPPQQNYGPPPPPQQNYGPPPPPQQNYGPPPPPPPQNYGPPPPQQNYGPPPPQQGYVPPPQQNYSPPGTGERRGPPYQGNLNQAEPGNHFAQGQRDFQQQRGFSC